MIIRPALWRCASLVVLALGSIHPGFAAEVIRYELQVGDEVRITVYKEPDMSGAFKIGTTGTVSVPGIGELEGAGLTSGELRDAAVQALVARHYANPSVTVEVSQYSPVFVMGDVRNPGRLTYSPRTHRPPTRGRCRGISFATKFCGQLEPDTGPGSQPRRTYLGPGRLCVPGHAPRAPSGRTRPTRHLRHPTRA